MMPVVFPPPTSNPPPAHQVPSPSTSPRSPPAVFQLTTSLRELCSGREGEPPSNVQNDYKCAFPLLPLQPAAIENHKSDHVFPLLGTLNGFLLSSEYRVARSSCSARLWLRGQPAGPHGPLQTCPPLKRALAHPLPSFLSDFTSITPSHGEAPPEGPRGKRVSPHTQAPSLPAQHIPVEMTFL